MDINERTKWAFAIAERISDEWDGARHFPEDAAKLRDFLEKALCENIEALKALIGTGVIESDYFNDI